MCNCRATGHVARTVEAGQATLIGMAIAFGCLSSALILFAVGGTYIAQAELQQAADVAATSLGTVVGDDPQARARMLARANGARSMSIDFVGNGAQQVVVRAPTPAFIGFGANQSLEARADIVITTRPDGEVGVAGSWYTGPLVAADASMVCPRVATDYKSMQRAAAAAGVSLWAVSGYRSPAEQAVLYRRLGPSIAAPPGTSLHHQATEIDIAVGATGSPVHQWLTTHAAAHGFTQRYAWEPWHWGNVRGC